MWNVKKLTVKLGQKFKISSIENTILDVLSSEK